MQLRHLQYFIAVAERLSFSKAALMLEITVPPLSRQIRQLEGDLGAQLFVRDHRRVVLTEAGRQLLPEAKELVAHMDRISHFVRKVQRGETGLLRVGIGFGLGEKISGALVEHARQYPGVEIRCEDLFTSSQIEGLHQGEIDVGFLRPPREGFPLASEFLFEENLVVHMSKANLLAKEKSLRIRDIAGEPLLLHGRTPSSGLHDKIFELYGKAGLTPRVIHLPPDSLPHGDVQTALVACRKGILIMPDEVACRPAFGSEVVAIPLDEPDARIEVHVAWRKEASSTVLMAFLNSVKTVFQKPSLRRCLS